MQVCLSLQRTEIPVTRLCLRECPICCHVFRQVGDGIALGLEEAGVERNTACGLGPKRQSMVHIIFVKPVGFDFLHGQVFGQLVYDGGNHFHVRQFFGTYIVLRNVPNQALYGQAQCLRLICT